MITWPPTDVPKEHRQAFTRQMPPCFLQCSQAFPCECKLKAEAVIRKDDRLFHQYRCQTCNLTASQAVKKQHIPPHLLSAKLPTPSTSDVPNLPAAMLLLRRAMGGHEQGFAFDRPEWRHLRDQALRRDGHRCRLCRNAKATSVHHRSYEHCDDNFVAPLDDLVSLCMRCHDIVHEWNPFEAAARVWGLNHNRKTLMELYATSAPALPDDPALHLLRLSRHPTKIWSAFRAYIHDRSEHRCEVCGRESSEIHHKVYRGVPAAGGFEPASDVVAMCRHCHESVHAWSPIQAFIPKQDESATCARNCASRYKGFFMHLLVEPYWYFDSKTV